MVKTVLNVGHCSGDHAAIVRVLNEHFQVEVRRSALREDTLRILRSARVDLVLVNRVLDVDGTEGLALIREIKSSPDLAGIPVMLVSSYSEHQAAAVSAGAEPGFGKDEIYDRQTREKLGRFLDRPPDAPA
jgi:CheY-like chemotaxis protein